MKRKNKCYYNFSINLKFEKKVDCYDFDLYSDYYFDNNDLKSIIFYILKDYVTDIYKIKSSIINFSKFSTLIAKRFKLYINVEDLKPIYGSLYKLDVKTLITLLNENFTLNLNMTTFRKIKMEENK